MVAACLHVLTADRQTLKLAIVPQLTQAVVRFYVSNYCDEGVNISRQIQWDVEVVK